MSLTQRVGVPLSWETSLSTDSESVAESRRPTSLHISLQFCLKLKKTHCDIYQADLALCGNIQAAGKWVAHGTHHRGIQYVWWAGLRNASQRDERIVQLLHKVYQSSSSPLWKRLGITFTRHTWLMSGWKYFTHLLFLWLNKLESSGYIWTVHRNKPFSFHQTACWFWAASATILSFHVCLWHFDRHFDRLLNDIYLHINLHYRGFTCLLRKIQWKY